MKTTDVIILPANLLEQIEPPVGGTYANPKGRHLFPGNSFSRVELAQAAVHSSAVTMTFLVIRISQVKIDGTPRDQVRPSKLLAINFNEATVLKQLDPRFLVHTRQLSEE